jgi:hypothetical protein
MYVVEAFRGINCIKGYETFGLSRTGSESERRLVSQETQIMGAHNNRDDKCTDLLLIDSAVLSFVVALHNLLKDRGQSTRP